jgi:hypothetical protein
MKREFPALLPDTLNLSVRGPYPRKATALLTLQPGGRRRDVWLASWCESDYDLAGALLARQGGFWRSGCQALARWSWSRGG